MASKKLQLTATAVLLAGAAATAAYLASGNKKLSDAIFGEAPPVASPRLPTSVVPKKYNIHLVPDLISCTFGGEVDIDVEIKERTKYITLNLAEIDLADQSIKLTISESGKVRR